MASSMCQVHHLRGSWSGVLARLAIRRAIRSSSSSVNCALSPSSAATTFSVDPSKNVSTRWRSADRRTVCRGDGGQIDEAQALFFVADVALGFEDPQLRADGGRARLAGQLAQDVGCRGAPEPVEDVDDLAFAPAQCGVEGLWPYVIFVATCDKNNTSVSGRQVPSSSSSGRAYRRRKIPAMRLPSVRTTFWNTRVAACLNDPSWTGQSCDGMRVAVLEILGVDRTGLDRLAGATRGRVAAVDARGNRERLRRQRGGRPLHEIGPDRQRHARARRRRAQSSRVCRARPRRRRRPRSRSRRTTRRDSRRSSRSCRRPHRPRRALALRRRCPLDDLPQHRRHLKRHRLRDDAPTLDRAIEGRVAVGVEDGDDAARPHDLARAGKHRVGGRQVER